MGILVGLGMLGGCASANASPPRRSEAPDRVTVVGDSLTVLGHEQVEDALSDAGWLVTTAAVPGRTAGTHMAALQDAARRGDRATVVELGTNDALWMSRGQLNLAQASADITAAIDGFADRCVVWVLPDRDPERHGAMAGVQIRDLVRNAAAGHENVHLADLGSVLADHPEYLVADHVHLTSDGYSALAALMANAVAACR